MSFVSLGGDGALRPTFFELVAADRLLSGLKAAISYSLGTLAQRRPAVHKILDWEDELFLVLQTLLDHHSLSVQSSTFADSLYGLRLAVNHGSAKSAASPPPLTRRQQQAALLLRVSVPYVSAKLDAWYQHATSAPAAESLPPPSQTWRQSARRLLLILFTRVYPSLYAIREGLHFVYQLMYLLEGTAYFSPILHLLRQRVVRVTAQELAQAERSNWQRRQGQLAHLAAWPKPVAWAWAALLRLGYLAVDQSRNALILSVFGFKLLEWWYMSGSQKLAAQKLAPPPPAPPPIHPAPGGTPLPEDRSLCPLCLSQRTNPAMAVVSGYVFCYPCLFNHLTHSGWCPVTRLPMTVANVRRLYQIA